MLTILSLFIHLLTNFFEFSDSAAHLWFRSGWQTDLSICHNHGGRGGKGNYGHLHCLRAFSRIAPYGHWLFQSWWKDVVFQKLPGHHEPDPLHGFCELSGLEGWRHEGCEGMLGDSKRCVYLHCHWSMVRIRRFPGNVVHGCYEWWCLPAPPPVETLDHCSDDDVLEGHYAEWLEKNSRDSEMKS